MRNFTFSQQILPTMLKSFQFCIFKTSHIILHKTLQGHRVYPRKENQHMLALYTNFCHYSMHQVLHVLKSFQFCIFKASQIFFIKHYKAIGSIHAKKINIYLHCIPTSATIACIKCFTVHVP